MFDLCIWHGSCQNFHVFYIQSKELKSVKGVDTEGNISQT